MSLDLSLGGGDVVVAFELNTLYTANQTIAAIAIDTDGDAATSSASLLGLTTTGADVAYQFDSGDPATNTITGRFPRPAGTTWKLWAAVAQADGTVMNVAFRGTREQANAGGSQFELTEALVFPYVGAFWEDRQAALLAAGDISGASYTVDVADLENAVTRGTAVTPGLHQRVYTSAYTQGAGEGIDPNGIPGRDSAMQPESFEQFFYYLGKYQPYGLYIPSSVSGPGSERGLFVQRHGANANHASEINQPGFVGALGETPARFIASAMGRGPHGWYSDISERDILDVRADMVANYPVDADQVVIGGYSMGGYGATRLAAYYPQLFAAAMNWAGFTGSGFNLPIGPSLNPLFAIEEAGNFPLAQSGIGAVDNVIDLIQNLRHVPTAIVYGSQDLNTPSHTAIWERFLSGEGPYQFWEYPVAEHFTFIVLDDWTREAAFTQDRVRVVDPARVSYRTNPSHDYPEYDIVHDSAYWVSEIRQRTTGYVDVDLTSRGCGSADPVNATGEDAGAGPAALAGVPIAWVSTFRDATGETPQPADNGITGSLSNASSLTVDVDGACLAPGTTYQITTDGPAAIHFSDGRDLTFLLAGTHSGSL